MSDPSKLTEAELRAVEAWRNDAVFTVDTGLEPPNRLELPRFTDLAEREIAPKVPLYEGFIYPGAYLLVGRPKVGKSWWMLQLALAAAEGRAFLGFQCVTPGEVLCILAEDDDARVKSRLQHMGYVTFPSNIHFVTQQGFIELAKKYAPHMTFEQFLKLYLKGHPGVKYCFLDTEVTIRQIWAGERKAVRELNRITESDYQQTRAYDEIALEFAVFIALTNHAKKRNGEEIDIHESINRSNTAFAGCSGSIVLADYPDRNHLEGSSNKRVLGIRARDLRDDVALALRQRAEDACFESLGAYSEVRQSEAEEEIMETVLRIQEEVGGASYTTNEDIAQELGLKTFTVKRRVSRMLEKPERRYWGKYIVSTKRGRNGGIRLDPR